MSHVSIRKQQGFTIIELMIATAVLSVMLLVVSTLMITIGRLYQKGVNQSKVQGAVRTITSDVSDNLKLSNKFTSITDINGTDKRVYCIGDTRYTYVVGRQLGTGDDVDGTPKSKHVLWRDKLLTQTCEPVADLDNPGTDGVEMLPSNSRLIVFNVSSETPRLTALSVAYGDSDLLSDDHDNLNWFTTCTGESSGQFCAVAKLTSATSQRITR